MFPAVPLEVVANSVRDSIQREKAGDEAWRPFCRIPLTLLHNSDNANTPSQDFFVNCIPLILVVGFILATFFLWIGLGSMMTGIRKTLVSRRDAPLAAGVSNELQRFALLTSTEWSSKASGVLTGPNGVRFKAVSVGVLQRKITIDASKREVTVSGMMAADAMIDDRQRNCHLNPHDAGGLHVGSEGLIPLHVVSISGGLISVHVPMPQPSSSSYHR